MSFEEESLEPGRQQGRTSAADANRDQCGLEQHCGVWSLAVLAVVWSLPQLYLESGIPHSSGSLDKCLGPPDAKWALSPGAVQMWLF